MVIQQLSQLGTGVSAGGAKNQIQVGGYKHKKSEVVINMAVGHLVILIPTPTL